MLMKKFLQLTLLGILCSCVTMAQDRTVKGTVVSQDEGTVLPGVNVLVKGTTVGTVTDINGNYTLNIPSGGNTLIFSFIGFVTEEIDIGARNVVDVRLTSDVQQLSEVVVTAIGLEANKRDLGYSIQNVDSDEIRKSGETNLVSALSGKAAGVQVINSSGTPGASAQIRIRGNKSVQGSNSPLFVVDGIPIDNSSFTTADSPEDAVGDRGSGGVTNSNRAIDINPDDIEALTILKGPAATALYGIRAANGAVVITTKKGSGKPKIVYSSSITVDRVNRLPDLQSEYAQGEVPDGASAPVYLGPETLHGTSWGPAISSLEFSTDPDHPNAPVNAFTGAPFGSPYPYDQNGFLVPAGTGNGTPARAYDNADNFFENAYTFNNHLSISGGTNDLNYYTSVGRLYQRGIVPNTDFQRTSFKVNVNSSITEKLKVGFSANYINSGGRRAQQGSNLSGVMLGLLRTAPTFDISNGHGEDGHEFVDAYAIIDGSPYGLPDGAPRSYRGNFPNGDAVYDNPYWTVNKNFLTDDVNRIIGFANLSYDFLPWLTASYKLGIDTYSDNRKFRNDINSGTFGPGQVIEQSINNTDINSDFLFIINKTLGEHLNLNAIVGHNYYSHETRNIRSDGKGLADREFYNLASATSINTVEQINRRELYGVYADFRLGYKDQYFLNLTGRNDWSSTLPESDNSFFYPAVSAGWAFTETFGLSGSSLLPYGKLRASWGQVGNDAPFALIDNNFTQARIVDGWTTPNGVIFPAFGLNAFQPNSILANPDLKAEITTTIELGFDLRFWDGRITADFTYYKANTEDNLLVVDIPWSSGYQQRAVNSGEIENEGVEIAINANIVREGDFTYDLGANFTKYTTTVVKMAPGLPFITIDPFGTQRLAEGEPYGIFYGSRFLRDDQGRMVIGETGIPLRDPNDGIVGDPTPDWLLGLQNTFTYKNLTLSAFFDIRKGGDIWNGTKGVLNNFGVGKETLDRNDLIIFDGVTIGDDGVTPSETINTQEVRKGGTDGGSNFYQSYGFTGLDELNVEDGSYIRLRELSLSYSFSFDQLRNVPLIEALDVRVFGRNLFLITDYTGIDPETNLTGDASNVLGYDYFNNPNTQSFGLSLNATF